MAKLDLLLNAQKSLGALCIKNSKLAQWFLPRAHIQEDLGSTPRRPNFCTVFFRLLLHAHTHSRLGPIPLLGRCTLMLLARAYVFFQSVYFSIFPMHSYLQKMPLFCIVNN